MKINNWMIVDRCPLYRNGLSDYIKQTQLHAIVDQTNSGNEALNKLTTGEPSIVIANIDLGEMDGIELFRTILHRGINHHHFVFVTELHWIENTYSRFANFLLWHLMKSGVKFIASKEELDNLTLNNLFQSIEQNKSFISFIIQQSYNNAHIENCLLENKLLFLTEREREYLLHFANHKSQHEIADSMLIGTNTINTYRERVLKKFTLNSTDDLKRFCSMYYLYNLNIDSINSHPNKNK